MDQKTESKRIKRFYIIIILFCITGKSAERHIFAVLKISEKTFTVHKRRESKKASIYIGDISIQMANIAIILRILADT